MRYANQLRTFLRILDEYPQDLPLSRFLPVFFRANKQMGSSDRKNASRLIYNYFRMGKVLTDWVPSERLFIAEFLCTSTPSGFLEELKPAYNANISLTLEEKIAYLKSEGINFDLDAIFPFTRHLSAGIDKEIFLKSFFIQPDLFIRVHTGKETFVKARLDEAGIAVTELSKSTLRLPNGTKLDQLFEGEAPAFEVQDLSSQQVGSFFKPQKWDYWWDACAASGGKSLLLHHQEPSVNLLVSDVRESILDNLDERFRNSGIVKYKKKVIDLLENPEPILHDFAFDGIILDVPCSGSGTWGRSPEMISQFREGKVHAFQHLQRSIMNNVVRYLKSGKPLIYITCSAFKEENEDNVAFLQSEFNLKLEAQQLFKGYEHKADTMFAARLIKP